MLKGANANVVTQELEKRVEKIQKLLPEGVSIEPYLNRSELVNRNISTVIHNLIEGAIIVFVVLIIFLGNVRAGLIVASVIPLAMLFAFILMRIFGVTANLMSLGAIDFGIVVDGSIVIVEGILAHLYGNKLKGRTLSKTEMDEEVEKGASGVVRSATFAVFIILIVFFPILTLNGIEGKYFAKEKFADQSTYHLNLYAVDDNGDEILMTKDHIIPRSKGGIDDISNYQTMCKLCNEAKGNKLED